MARKERRSVIRFHSGEMDAMLRVMDAAARGADARVMVRSQLYAKAKAKLMRCYQAALRKKEQAA